MYELAVLKVPFEAPNYHVLVERTTLVCLIVRLVFECFIAPLMDGGFIALIDWPMSPRS